MNLASIASNGLNLPRPLICFIRSSSPRHQRHSTALVTNIDFDGWADYLADGPLAMAFLDRLVEGAVILKIKGKSYRARASKQKNDASDTPGSPSS